MRQDGHAGMVFAQLPDVGGVNSSCTSQWPFQAMIFTLVCAAMFCARYSSGSMMTRSTPSDSTTLSALPEVQQMSDSAFTAAEVLT